MNFFQHQDNARRSTRRLVVLFSLAVIALLLITNIALIGSLWFFDATIVQSQNARLQNNPQLIQNFFQYFNWILVLKVSGTVVTVIAFVIFLKRSELSGGGKAVAERLGGRKIDLSTSDPYERIILNVVEEMAIASGMPVPPVYLLRESGINAFAAGFNTSDAVIGISKGAIENLNRDQLQGVVAHEFSHIFNGDMRLNINLIAVLEGILFIGHTGRFVVRSFGGSRRRSSRDSGSAIALVGLLFVVIGFIGTFFGQLIKSAVSRQREFLADASAVQFTRNPEGIAGALKLIGGSRFGSRLNAPHAEEMSHLFFGDALVKKMSFGLAGLFATHPALEERIRRIEPRWDGYYLKMTDEDEGVSSRENKTPEDPKAKAEKIVQVLTAGAVLGGVEEGIASVKSEHASRIKNLSSSVDNIGEPDENSYASAQLSLQAIDKKIKQALKQSHSTRALIYLMLLNTDVQSRQLQLAYLQEHEDKSVRESMKDLLDAYTHFPKSERLNLVDLAIPALKEMSKQEYQLFLKHLVYLVKADRKIDLFEWLLHSLLVHYLKPNYEKTQQIQAKYRDLNKLRNECKFLLSHLSYFGGESETISFQDTFESGFSLLDLGDTKIVDQAQLKIDDLNNAMHHFVHLYPLVKPKLLKACAACIQAGGAVTVEQFELLRTIAALLDCPMPIMNVTINKLEGAL